ncbi:hypothetical protein CEXT_252931 [Caerostris extrusa]|uniref:Uncharacterized protein n=1 Tax=Caerostris extrusa TaxID=172846 RepID=A0AAV4U6U1_CAEEX|nr:hypothetical protein CEXT_252931 [Caerostris extrusa]
MGISALSAVKDTLGPMVCRRVTYSHWEDGRDSVSVLSAISCGISSLLDRVRRFRCNVFKWLSKTASDTIVARGRTVIQNYDAISGLVGCASSEFM